VLLPILKLASQSIKKAIEDAKRVSGLNITTATHPPYLEAYTKSTTTLLGCKYS